MTSFHGVALGLVVGWHLAAVVPLAAQEPKQDRVLSLLKELTAFFERVAAEKGIAVQTEITDGGAEDSAEMQRWDTGRPAINYAVAVRYLHGHHAMVERKDIDQSIELLVAAVAKLDAATVKGIATFQ